MIKNITDKYDHAVQSVNDLLEGNTAAKKTQQAVLVSGVFSSLCLKAASSHYYPKIGDSLPNLGVVLIMALSILGFQSIKDYENVAEVEAMRKEALPLDLFQVVSLHGSVKTVLDSKVLSVEELTQKAKVCLEADTSGISGLTKDLRKAYVVGNISEPVIHDVLRQMKGHTERLGRTEHLVAEMTEWKKQNPIV